MAFNRDSRGGGRDFGRRSFGGDRGGPREMFKATCSKCGKECEVPFKPTGSKPVFCSDCFREQGGPDRRSEGRDDRRSSGPSRSDFSGGRSSDHPQYKEQFEALNNKLDKILNILAPHVVTEAASQEAVVVPEKKKRVVKKAEEVVLTPEEAPVIESTPDTSEEVTS